MKKLDLGIRAKAYGSLFLEGAKDYVGEPFVIPTTLAIGLVSGVVSKDITTGMREAAEHLGISTILAGGLTVILNRQVAKDEIAYYTDTERA